VALRGYDDVHNHLLAQLGFVGPAFHGLALGPTGQASAWCNLVHGPEGPGDIVGTVMGVAYDTGGGT
jgi:hypothetical protein